MPLDAAIGSFFVEFSKFDMTVLSGALRSISKDDALVERADERMNLDARLTLLRRMAFARALPSPVMKDLEAVLSRARRLRKHRDAVAANLTASTVRIPQEVRLEEYTAEAVALQRDLKAVTQSIEATPRGDVLSAVVAGPRI